MTVSLDGRAVYYEDCGTGSPLLLLHGWGVDTRAYASLIKALQDRHRVLAVDLPGFGRTPEPASPWRLEDYIVFVHHFCAALALEEIILVGHSNGARIALGLMADPQPTLTVSKAVLFGAAGLRTRRSLAWYVKVYAYKLTKQLLRPFPALLARLQKNAGSADYRNASPVMRGTMSNLLAEDLYDRLADIPTPTLLIYGENDTATPVAMGRRMAAAIPDAGLVVVPRTGHYAFAEDPAFCNRVLHSFLGDTV